MSEPQKSFFQTFTGVITAITSLIIAVTGLYAATGGFNFNNGPKPAAKLVGNLSEQDHQKQLQALKRQKELDDLRINQEKQKLLAEQELAALRAKNNQADTFAETINGNNYTQHNITSNINGRWNYSNQVGTYVFVFEQNGNEVFLQEYDSYGNNVGNGSGVVQGTNVLLNWVEPYLFVMSLQIEAELTIGSQGNVLNGYMYAEGNTLPITLFRQ
ncbi:hypothetical protein [Paraglaciecola arctica]|uniref:Uncharacterized protein n=1 Tax=Paraglaciecola arctica BSs20135 TaxID=493475 RepID=K6XA35_9ALTE|nr:hypothetical protein [Paraglaciecola arctica]GAC17479.1 hypothetical protein GARC_0497 [Paraglaciecola arctica BSs20135]